MSEETKRYSKAPFISHDGPDEHGVRAEVKVVVGFGSVSNVEPSKAGKAKKVSFEVDNTEYTISGWAPSDSEIIKKVEEAQKNDEPIHFRIETRRKRGIDRTTPISVLLPPKDMNAARDNGQKSLAAVRFDDDENWTISSLAVTRLEEDPADGFYSAYDHDAEELAPAQSPSNNGSENARSFESTPFFPRNRDGSVNAGSIAVSVPVSLFSFISQWEREHDAVKFEDKAKFALTKALLEVANRLQVSIYDDEEKISAPDLSLGSHTRARNITFEVIRDFYPITNEVAESSESIQKWADEVFEKSLAVFQWSIKTVEPYI